MRMNILLLGIAMGALLMHSYLYSIRVFDAEVIPFWSLWIGVLVCSVSAVGLFLAGSRSGRDLPYVLIGIFMLSLTFLLLPTTRFETPFGPASGDTPQEFGIANETFLTKRWPIRLVDVNQYASVLSVTILPAICAEVGGFPVEYVFKFVFPFLGALIPILIFLMTREFFGETRCGLLAALLYSTSYWYIFLQSDIKKELVSISLLALALWALPKFRDRKFRSISFLMLVGVILAHYTVADLAMVSLLGAMILPRVFRKILSYLGFRRLRVRATLDTRIVTWELLGFFAAAAVAWLSFVNFTLWRHHVAIGERALLSILGLYQEFLHGSIKRAMSATGGPVVTVWFYLQFLLIFLGTMYSFVRYLRSPRKSVIPAGGFTMMAFVGLSLLGPAITKGLSPERWIDFGFVFFSGCIATLFIRFWSFSRFKYVFLLFLLVSPTMNLMLPSRLQPIDILYHPESGIPTNEVALQAPMHAQDLRLAEFISDTVPASEPVITDMVGVFALKVSNHRCEETLPTPERPSSSVGYLVLSGYFIKHRIWVTYDASYTRVIRNPDILDELLRYHNVIYSSGTFLLLG